MLTTTLVAYHQPVGVNILSEKFDEVLKALKPSRIIDKEINLIYGAKSDINESFYKFTWFP